MTTNRTTTATGWPTVTPSDSALLNPRPAALQIGGSAGDLTIVDEYGNSMTIPVTAGQVVFCAPAMVMATGTDASPVYALHNMPIPN